MTGHAGTGDTGTRDTGLGWYVDGDRAVLVLSEASATLRRKLGPTAWSVLETLTLAARPTVAGELVASANAREIAIAVGLGRDAATKALALLREHELIVMEQPRRDDGQFRPARYAICVQRVEGTTCTPRRSHAVPARQAAVTPTLFDTPIVDTGNPDNKDSLPEA